MANTHIEVDKKIEEKINSFIDEYKKDSNKNKFPLDEEHFKEVFVFFGKKPKNNPFPLGSFGNISIYLGGDE